MRLTSTILAVVLYSGCVFGSGGTPAGNNARQNNTNDTRSETIANNGTTSTNNATVAPNNVTISPNNGTVGMTTGTTSTTGTNNQTTACDLDTSVVGQLCMLADDDPVSMPLAGDLPLPESCAPTNCGMCDPTSLRGNYCLPAHSVYTSPAAGWGHALALSDELLVIAPNPGTDLQIVDLASSQPWGTGIPSQAGQNWGRAISLTGSTLAVSIPSQSVVTLYELDVNNRTAQDSAELPPPNQLATSATQWGWALAAGYAGGTKVVFIGAPDVNYVTNAYRMDADQVWQMTPFDGAMVAPNLPSDARYGAALALDRQVGTLAVGAPGEGRVYLWKWAAGWQLMGHVEPSVASARFGEAVALNGTGDLLAVGNPGLANNAGSVTLYRRTGDNWTQVDRWLAAGIGGVGAGGRLGASVALHGNSLFAGAPGADTTIAFVGTPDIGYVQAGSFRPGLNNLREGFGTAIATTGSHIAVSSTNADPSSELSIVFVGEYGTGPSQ